MAYSPTAFQFTHLLQRTLDRLEQTKTLTATGGSTLTVVDSGINADIQDDTYNGYTVFVNYDATGAGAAPEGEIRTVSDYVQSTTTLTVSVAFSAAIAAGDIIVLARKSLFPLGDVKRLCNNALKKLGEIPVPDTSLTTASAQTEYDMPSGVRWDDIVSVEIQGITTDANDNRYYKVRPRDIIPPTTPGGTATLILDQYPSGKTIRIISIRPHADLRDYDDDISPAIHEELAVSACALECAKWQRSAAAEQIPILQQDFASAYQLHPVPRYVKQINGMPHWKSHSAPADEFTSPDPA